MISDLVLENEVEATFEDFKELVMSLNEDDLLNVMEFIMDADELYEEKVVRRKKAKGKEKIERRKKAKKYARSAKGKKAKRKRDKIKARKPDKGNMTYDVKLGRYTKKKTYKDKA